MKNENVFSTSDLGLAVFLAWKGTEEALPPWEKVVGRDRKTRIKFRFLHVKPELIMSYKRDTDGFQRYNGLRRLYLRIIKSETGENENDR